MGKHEYAQLIDAKLKILILYLVASALLWLGYAKFIVPYYGYQGFDWSPNMVKVVESLSAIVFFALSLPSSVRRPSDFLIHVQFLLPVVPMLVLYGASDLPRSYTYLVLSGFAVVCLVREINFPKIKGAMIPIPVMMYGLLLAAAIYILSIIGEGGLRYFNLDPLKVYEFRTIAAQNLPVIYGYLSPMVSKIVLPFILLLAFSQRKWFIAGLALLGSVMMFALTSNKGPLYYPFLVMGIYYIARFRLRMIRLLLVGYIILIIIPLVPFLIRYYIEIEIPFTFIAIGGLLLNRGYFIPAKINFDYYDFFSTHPHTMLAESKLTFGLVDYPYDLEATHLIGYYYSNNAMVAANTGWVGSGYMQFGFVGILIYALVVGLLMSLLDTYSRGRDLPISVAIFFVPFFTIFLSADLPTAMLTHGMLLALFLYWLSKLDENTRTILRRG